MKDLEDPELKELAGRLPHTILHSRADSTVKKYCGAFKRWKIWAASHKLLAIPAKPHEFALYLQFIGEHSVSKSAVEEACNALSWVHSVSGLDSPTTHPRGESYIVRPATHFSQAGCEEGTNDN